MRPALARYRGLGLAMFASVLLLLLPALWNGFPLVFSDTGIYLDAAINHHVPIDRPLFYSVFALALHWKISLWPIVVAQALITFYLVRLFFRTYSPRFAESDVVIVIAVLSGLSSLPWFVGQIMPDLFAALLILALAIGVLNQDRLDRPDYIALPVLSTFFISTHLSYVLLAAAVLACAALMRAADRRGARLRALLSRFNMLLAGGLVLAVGMMVAINVVARKGPTVAYVGNVMMLAKLIDQEVAIDYLNDTCAARPLPICSALPDLVRMRDDARLRHLPIGSVSDDFLWGPEIKKLGDFGAVRLYASEINQGAIRRYPLKFIEKCFDGFLAQSMKFQLGDDLIRNGEGTMLYDVMRDSFHGRSFERYQASRQYAGTIKLATLKALSNAVVPLSLLAVIAFIALRRSAARAQVQVMLVILFGIVVNLAVTGALSAVHDRYGSRVIWLLPMLALLAGFDFYHRRRRVPAPPTAPA